MNTTVQPLLDIVGKSKCIYHNQHFKRKNLEEHQKRKQKWDHNI